MARVRRPYQIPSCIFTSSLAIVFAAAFALQGLSNGYFLFFGAVATGHGGRFFHIGDGLAVAEHANAPGPGLIGWHYPDEWDAFLDGAREGEFNRIG